jgi:succinyl-diaminopimelate desuccinylase
VLKCFRRPPAIVERSNPFVRALADAVANGAAAESVSVGRDGSSDAVSFLAAGVPAVEFGPEGGGHHGPEEWVSIGSLDRYRDSLVSFVELLGERTRDGGRLRFV